MKNEEKVKIYLKIKVYLSFQNKPSEIKFTPNDGTDRTQINHNAEGMQKREMPTRNRNCRFDWKNNENLQNSF